MPTSQYQTKTESYLLSIALSIKHLRWISWDWGTREGWNDPLAAGRLLQANAALHEGGAELLRGPEERHVDRAPRLCVVYVASCASAWRAHRGWGRR